MFQRPHTFRVQVVDALAAQYAGVSELLKDTEEAVVAGRTGKEAAMAGALAHPGIATKPSCVLLAYVQGFESGTLPWSRGPCTCKVQQRAH